MDLKNMSPKDKQRYEIMIESRKQFLEDLKNGIIPNDYEDIIYMIWRNEYKRGKADGWFTSPINTQKETNE